VRELSMNIQLQRSSPHERTRCSWSEVRTSAAERAVLTSSRRSGSLRALVRNLQTREATWSWMKAHPDVLAAQVPELFKYTLPNVAAPFCDSRMAAQLEGFFKRHGSGFPGTSVRSR
jgi:hypothetical protein